MPPITIYTLAFCPFCSRAMKLLDAKGATYEQIDVTFKPGVRADMRERSGGANTLPQIFIGDTHVGGCDELHALDGAGGLDPLLEGAA
jgi:glutaredoxin 3